MPNFKTISGRKIRIALAGCGRISKSHLEAISQYSEDFEITGIYDIQPSALNAVVETYPVNAYDDFRRLLENESPDLVTLCTPSGLHSSQAILAAQFGVNVVTEKPMATKLSDGLAMVNACDEAGVRLFVVKQNRENATLKLLKRALTEQRFGRINMVHINVFWTRPQSYYDHGDGWRGTWAFDGGAFMNQASHYVDLLDWMFGPVESLQAMMSTSRNIETEDTGVLNIRWRNGCLGSMAVTMLTYPKNLEGSLTVLGEKGTVKIGGLSVNEIQTWDFAESRDYDDEVKAANVQMLGAQSSGHMMYYRNVIDVLRGRAEPKTDGRSGLKSLEILTAAYISARDRVSVGLPLVL